MFLEDLVASDDEEWHASVHCGIGRGVSGRMFVLSGTFASCGIQVALKSVPVTRF